MFTVRTTVFIKTRAHMNGNDLSKVYRSRHKGGRDRILGSRAFRWLRGLWKKRGREPSFKLIRMKRIPTSMLKYFEPYGERGDSDTKLPLTPKGGFHDINERPLEYRSVYHPTTTGYPRRERGPNLLGTAGCYVAYRPGAGRVPQRAFNDVSKEAEVNRNIMNSKTGGIASDGAPGRPDSRFVNQGFANNHPPGMTLRRGMAVRRNTAPKQPTLPKVEQESQGTCRESAGARTVKHRVGAPCSQPLAVVTPTPTPTISNGEQRPESPDARNMLPSQQRHRVIKFPKIATPSEGPAVMRPTPPAVPRSLSLRRQPGYRSLRQAATEMDRTGSTPLLSHLTRPSYVLTARSKSSGSSPRCWS
ncbi:uncharacterized protein B0H64DRAFT_449240, partial [Chaetomium fimeti]